MSQTPEIGRTPPQREPLERVHCSARPLLDMETLVRTVGSEELVGEIAALFLEEAPRMVGDVHEALERGDTAALRRALHALEGAVGNFEPRPVLRTIRALSALARAGRLTGGGAAGLAARARRRLARQLDRLGSELRELAGRSAPVGREVG